MELDKDLEIIEVARQAFAARLREYPPVKITCAQYARGVSALSQELIELSAQVSSEIRGKYGLPLTYNQASIALVSAMNGLNLIEIAT
jgi:hypothetical protein